MKFIYTSILISLFASTVFSQARSFAFKTAQLKNPRVKEAYEAKWNILKSELQTAKINPNEFDIYVRIFKADKLAEVWLRSKGEVRYHLFRTYDICTNTGDIGQQVPEGFYKVSLFNPKSKDYLSMQINNLNSKDASFKKEQKPCGAIMLNGGDCSAISGVSMSNDKIKELYILCLEVRNRNNPIYIDVYPTKLSAVTVQMLKTDYPERRVSFWKALKCVYDFFEENKWLPSISVDRRGRYVLSEGEKPTTTTPQVLTASN